MSLTNGKADTKLIPPYTWEREARERLGDEEFDRRASEAHRLATEDADVFQAEPGDEYHWFEASFYGGRYKQLLMALGAENAAMFVELTPPKRRLVIQRLIERGKMI